MLLESGQRLGLRACASEQTTPFRKTTVCSSHVESFYDLGQLVPKTVGGGDRIQDS
jgi:hypothetical protein